MTAVETTSSRSETTLDRLLGLRVKLNWEVLAYAVLIAIAIITRFYSLDTRVMSHDESLHTYYSWRLEQGWGFQHTPMMHGPLQFHLVALSYFLFGDSDAAARVPVAVAGVVAVGLVVLFRRWLGRTGALVAATLMVFSPYMLFYSRYVRNEAYVVAIALAGAYAVFRYMETRAPRWLYLYVFTLSLHFITKETAFLYTAQWMAFLGAYFAWRVLRSPWEQPRNRTLFAIGLGATLLGGLVMALGLFRDIGGEPVNALETGQPLDLTTGLGTIGGVISPFLAMGAIIALAGVILLAVAMIFGYGKRLRKAFPSFDLLLVTITLMLPQLAALPANMLGWDPMAYDDPVSTSKTAIVVAVLTGLALAIGLVWDRRRWLISAAVFYVPFFVLYTTLFTNPAGVATGLVGSLGYWMAQHGVRRGSQPWYYYLLIQIPIYEFLPAIGALGALALELVKRWRREPAAEMGGGEQPGRAFPVLPFIGFWAITSLFAYSFAGERMPWLTVHITLPFILLAGWSFGRLLEAVDWRAFREGKAWLVLTLGVLSLLALAQALGSLLGDAPPFAGSELSQLQATTGFLVSLFLGLGSLAGTVALARGWKGSDLAKLASVSALGILFLLTVRTAFRAAYVNYDRATEYLVYAHSATGVKTVMRQVEELSRRMTDGLAIDVGYDDDVSWPFTWYLRNFTNNHFYGPNPTREILNYPVVIAGDNNWGKVEPILGNRYYRFEYIRMWWPMQDYFGLTWERVRNAITSSEYRAALWDIWLNRDYSAYGALTGNDFSLENWQPSDRMRLYIRKDVAAMVWDYGGASGEIEAISFEDPYAKGMQELNAEVILGEAGSGPSQFQAPRGIAVARDGSIYVADSRNFRVQRLSPEGPALDVWGTFADVAQGEAPGGTFNEPWGLAVAPDGSVYVADTWNHRVQRFTAEGEFLQTFGYFGAGEAPTGFWGPRDIAVDDQGRVFVTDTGNKRVVVFNAEGAPLTEFGGPGAGPGQLAEPVGLAIDGKGRIYVADTWNQRVQVFEEVEPLLFQAVQEWPIDGWYGESLENKPFIAADRSGHICLTDPEGYRVLCFSEEGDFLLGWGDFGVAPSEFGMPSGIAFDAQGGVWVSDAGNNRLMRFEPEFP